MRPGRASQTAQWVALARSAGSLLPSELRLASDPYGVQFAQPHLRHLVQPLLRMPRLSHRLLTRAHTLYELVLWMQLRTRALDDLMLDYVRGGGRQVVILGAGFDCRALRFARELAATNVYEVDHPATQQAKRVVLAQAPAANMHYVGWDFEREPLAQLPPRLASLGLDTSLPTLTLWEGVTMYLSESAIDESVRAVHALGGAGSLLAFNYIDRNILDAASFASRSVARVVKRAGEPYRFGWQPAELGAWFEARGFALVRDESDLALAGRYWPTTVQPLAGRDGRRLAVVQRAPELA